MLTHQSLIVFNRVNEDKDCLRFKINCLHKMNSFCLNHMIANEELILKASTHPLLALGVFAKYDVTAFGSLLRQIDNKNLIVSSLHRVLLYSK